MNAENNAKEKQSLSPDLKNTDNYMKDIKEIIIMEEEDEEEKEDFQTCKNSMTSLNKEILSEASHKRCNAQKFL